MTSGRDGHDGFVGRKGRRLHGGTQGLGAAIATLFAQRGAAGIVVCGRNAEKGRAKAEAIRSETGCQTEVVQADLSQVADCSKVVEAADRAFGRIDVLVNAARSTDRGTIVDTTKNWRLKATSTFDCEFGFSNMGYEIAAGWGAAIADPTRTPIVLIGDGTYMMMNSDIYSSVLAGHKFILIVCDNGGYAVINRLQIGKGAAPFNNLIRDCRVKEPFAVDFAQHAESMGALTRRVESLADFGLAMDWAKTTDRTTVITIVSDAFRWSPGDAWWDVGVPQVSHRQEVREARAVQEEKRREQRVGV